MTRKANLNQCNAKKNNCVRDHSTAEGNLPSDCQGDREQRRQSGEGCIRIAILVRLERKTCFAGAQKDVTAVMREKAEESHIVATVKKGDKGEIVEDYPRNVKRRC